jgi:hypothetical protein
MLKYKLLLFCSQDMPITMMPLWVLAYSLSKCKLRMLLCFLRKDAHSKFMTNYQTIRRKNFQQIQQCSRSSIYEAPHTKLLLQPTPSLLVNNTALVCFHWLCNVAPSSMAHHISNGNACATNNGWNLDRTSGSSANCKWALQACCKLWVGLLFVRDIY